MWNTGLLEHECLLESKCAWEVANYLTNLLLDAAQGPVPRGRCKS